MRVRRCTTGTRRTPQFSTTVEIHGFADVTLKRRRLKSTTPLRAAVDMVLDRAQLQSSSVAPSEVSLAIRPRKDYPPAPDIAEELDSLLVKEPQLRVLL